SYPSTTSATPETSAEIASAPIRSSVPASVGRSQPILRKESNSSASSDTESILSVISNDGTAAAHQV
ncbi:hypothetical protein FRB90_006619, partial [Tulasnella sp. 427]